jgi:hypothetical protein
MTDIVGKLVFDSWADALPELRSSAERERHLIYEGGGVLLDLLLKPADTGASLEVGGQVMPTDGATQSVSHVPVMLENGQSCSRTHTNALGEFSFHHAPSNGCFDVSIVFGARRFVVRGLESSEPRKWQVVTSNREARAAKEGVR